MNTCTTRKKTRTTEELLASAEARIAKLKRRVAVAEAKKDPLGRALFTALHRLQTAENAVVSACVPPTNEAQRTTADLCLDYLSVATKAVGDAITAAGFPTPE